MGDTALITDSPVTVTDMERREALARRVGQEVGGGWHVESQSEFQAVLVKPGTNVSHLLHLILTLLTLGLWAIVWILVAVFKSREHHKVIAVDAFGNVSVKRR